jgi:iron complex outermembrane receptor protein
MSNAAAAAELSQAGSAEAQAQPEAGDPASTPSAAADAGQREIGDIIVTARRRDESLSDVPIAIAVLSGDSLNERSVRSETDLQFAFPGLTVRQTGTSNTFNFSIRGQSIDAYSNSAPGVLPYLNDAQLNTLSAQIFYDFENVQVLKGPQGTLFGRNATGGAVLYTTTRPGDTLEGYASARYGNYDSYQIGAAITLPIAEAVSLRLAGNLTGGGAYVTNEFNGEQLGDTKSRSIRGTLLIQPTSNIENLTTVQYSRDTGTSVPSIIYSVNACGSTNNGIPLNTVGDCFFNPANPIFQAYIAANPDRFPGGMTALLERQREWGPYRTDIDGPSDHFARAFFVINKTEIDIGPDMTIKNIVMYNRSKRNDPFDVDGTPYGIFATIGNAQEAISHQFSEELQLQGTTANGALQYTIGAYYLNQRDSVFSQSAAFDLTPIAPPQIATYSFVARDISKAAFAQLTYKITDQLNVTGGIRYTHDKIVARNLPGSAFGVSRQETSQGKPSWTASLDYKATPDLLLYVATRGSWRTGGFNYTSVPIDEFGETGGNAFRPETTQDVEAGLKYSGRLGNTPATLTLAVFNQWIQDVQRATFVDLGTGVPALVTSNVPAAEVTGFEAAATARPADWLTIGANVTYLDGRFTDPNTLAFGVPVTYGPYGDTPSWTGSANIEISKDLAGDTGTVSLRGDVFAQTSNFFSNLADTITPDTKLPGYALVNARLSWSDMFGTGITSALYVTNLFDEAFYAGGLPTSAVFGTNSASPGRPRMFGAEIRVDF